MTIAFTVRLSRSARRALEHELPESVAAAALEFIFGPLRENPYRVGKPLLEPLAPQYAARRGDYRIRYLIHDGVLEILVVAVIHRRDAYGR